LALATGAYAGAGNHRPSRVGPQDGSATLPFTGSSVLLVLIAGAVVVMAGLGLRRSLIRRD
jgi:hypothetical protein